MGQAVGVELLWLAMDIWAVVSPDTAVQRLTAQQSLHWASGVVAEPGETDGDIGVNLNAEWPLVQVGNWWYGDDDTNGGQFVWGNVNQRQVWEPREPLLTAYNLTHRLAAISTTIDSGEQVFGRLSFAYRYVRLSDRDILRLLGRGV